MKFFFFLFRVFYFKVIDIVFLYFSKILDIGFYSDFYFFCFVGCFFVVVKYYLVKVSIVFFY